MKKIILAAKSTNDVLGLNGDLPWHLPADLAFLESWLPRGFLLTGRTSYESPQGREVFDHRDDVVVVSRTPLFQPKRGLVAHSVEAAFAAALAAGAQQLLILGGAEIYRQTIDLADEMVLTEVAGIFAGDSFFPPIDPQRWEELSREQHPADPLNPYPYAFVHYRARR